MKLRVEDVDEKSNLGRIVAGKLAVCCITNLLVDIPALSTLAPDYLIIPLIVFLVFPASGFSALSCANLDFPTPNYPASDFFTLFIVSWPLFPCFDFSIVSLVGLNAFLYAFSTTPLIDVGIVRLLAKVLTNLFGNNPSIIAYYSDNNSISRYIY